MSRDLVVKSLRDNRAGTIAWGLVLVASVALQMAVYPTVRDAAAGFEQLLSSYPEAFKAMFDIQGTFADGAGYVRAEVFGLFAPLVVLGVAIGQASRCTAGEERAGTMDLLVANPVSRREVLLDKAFAVLVDLVVVAAALAAVLLAANALVGLDIPPVDLVVASLLSAVLALPFGALALLVGALTGSRGLAVAAPVGAAVVTFLVQTLAELADWLRPWRVLSPFHHAGLGDAVSGNADALGALVLLGTAGILLALAVLAFERRDLATR
ncbi:ABC transporter permease [Umezawaea endophytica]|uniref:ABC transporter permease n=1 Tax=Umezawaea endophytica TaxID=1654476 RepID=A0A9X2VZQ4_9PSEU|nr:ABC transporter permease [Umezawaea endophytica]MCS7484748.1 ABC transporter permease [Umezawaea endophytica]